jgi:exonuclease III
MGITVGTFNILDPIFAVKHRQPQGLVGQQPPDGERMGNWPTRKDRIVQLIKASNLDVINLQEVSRKSLAGMEKEIEKMGYGIKYVKHTGRHDGLAILYKMNKLEEQNFCCHSKKGLKFCYIDLRVINDKEKKIIRVANCHLKGGDPENQKIGTAQIEKLVAKVNKGSKKMAACIITGDLNACDYKNDPKFRALKAKGYEFDGNIDATEINKQGTKRHIDWIWVRSSSAQLAHLIIQQPILSLTNDVSDHVLSATRIVFSGQKLKTDLTPSLFQNAMAHTATAATASATTLFRHTQPKGSFREKIMNHFSVRVPGWDDDLKSAFSKKLDDVLLQCAKVKKEFFLKVIRDKFAADIDQLNDEEKEILKSDLELAIKAATKPHIPHNKQEKPHAASVKPPVASVSPVPSVTWGQRIKGFFSGIASFFAGLFRFR